MSVAAVAVLLDPGVALGAEPNKQVLELYSTRRDAALSVVGERELSRILDAGLNGRVDYYSEYIDLSRFSDPRYVAGFREFLRLKYSGHHFDVVVALEDASVEFVRHSRDDLFPGTPVVFLAVQRGDPPIENSTGVFLDLDFNRTVKLATRLLPDVEQVFVVSGAASRDAFYLNLARQQFDRYPGPLTFTYFGGLARNDLEHRLNELPPRSIVYYLVFSQDGLGVNVRPLDYLDRVTKIANAPVFSWNDAGLDHGIVGGSLLEMERALSVIGNQTVRVLHGERASRVAVLSGTGLQAEELDWRQVERWKIRRALVPAAARIRFREFSVWDRYRLLIVGAIAVVFAQTLLIASLLLQASRRRRAEAQVRRDQRELQASYEQIRRLGVRLIDAQEAERSRIARELHDDLGQQIALLAIDLDVLSRDGHGPHYGNGMAGEALRMVHGLAASVRALSHRLHPSNLRLTGLVASLTTLQREVSQPGVAVTFTHEHVPAEIPYELSVCLYRIAQEAVHNAIGHGDAHMVTITVRGCAAGLALTVIDDGSGFDVESAWGKGLGLVSMAERLEPFGGQLDIQSHLGVGTCISVIAPVQPMDAAGAVPARAATVEDDSRAADNGDYGTAPGTPPDARSSEGLRSAAAR